MDNKYSRGNSGNYNPLRGSGYSGIGAGIKTTDKYGQISKFDFGAAGASYDRREMFRTPSGKSDTFGLGNAFSPTLQNNDYLQTTYSKHLYPESRFKAPRNYLDGTKAQASVKYSKEAPTG